MVVWGNQMENNLFEAYILLDDGVVSWEEYSTLVHALEHPEKNCETIQFYLGSEISCVKTGGKKLLDASYSNRYHLEKDSSYQHKIAVRAKKSGFLLDAQYQLDNRQFHTRAMQLKYDNVTVRIGNFKYHSLMHSFSKPQELKKSDQESFLFNGTHFNGVKGEYKKRGISTTYGYSLTKSRGNSITLYERMNVFASKFTVNNVIVHPIVMSSHVYDLLYNVSERTGISGVEGAYEDWKSFLYGSINTNGFMVGAEHRKEVNRYSYVLYGRYRSSGFRSLNLVSSSLVSDTVWNAIKTKSGNELYLRYRHKYSGKTVLLEHSGSVTVSGNTTVRNRSKMSIAKTIAPFILRAQALWGDIEKSTEPFVIVSGQYSIDNRLFEIKATRYSRKYEGNRKYPLALSFNRNIAGLYRDQMSMVLNRIDYRDRKVGFMYRNWVTLIDDGKKVTVETALRATLVGADTLERSVLFFKIHVGV